MLEYKTFYKHEEINGKFILVEKKSYRPGFNCFNTKEESINHYNKSKEIAISNYRKIKEKLAEIHKLYEFSYDYFVEGDQDGITNDGIYIEVRVNGYYFKFNQ